MITVEAEGRYTCTILFCFTSEILLKKKKRKLYKTCMLTLKYHISHTASIVGPKKKCKEVSQSYLTFLIPFPEKM